MIHPKLTQARMLLLIKEPFFANLALQLKLREDPTCPTAATNGSEIKYNSDFIDSLSGPQAVFLMCHEVLHCALGHCTRRGERHPERWNVAADFVINLILQKSGFTFPPGDPITLNDVLTGTQKEGYLLDTSLSDFSTEEIYAKLPTGIPSGYAAFGVVSDPSNSEGEGKGNSEGPALSSQEVAAALDAKWRVALAQAANAARAKGSLPGHLAKLVEDILHPKLPWTQLLRQFVRDLSCSDYSWLHPQRVPLALFDLILPSLKSETCGEIVVAVDTSGSIACDAALLAEFVAELNSILDDVRPSKLTVLDIDARVHSAREFLPGDTVPNQWIGCGGTDFRPAFDHVEASGATPCCLIYLTDMYGDFPREDPGYPVLWISYSDCQKAPFGSVIDAR